MEKLYLAKQPDGTEIATNSEPFRVHDMIRKYVSATYMETHPIDHYYMDCWMDNVSDTDYGYYGFDYSFDGIELPKGTIEKLTGKNICWDDEPIVIESF